MKRILLIDDFRSIEQVHVGSEPYKGKIAKNYEEGIKLLKQGPWDILYLDHDLGDWSLKHKELTGYDVICWLEEHTEYLPIDGTYCCSSNPVGRQRIQMVIDKLYKNR